MKKFFFYILSSFLIILITYFFLAIYTYLDFQKNKKFLFKEKDLLEFHIKYSEKIHHLRDVNRWGIKPNNYLFTEFIDENENDRNKNLIMIQGDSWIEQMLEYNKSKILLENYKGNLINAGVTSFSPSPMFMQYKILKEDFKIKPRILIIYIDQTDIGDEVCRYKKKLIFNKNSELIKIQRETYSNSLYDYTKIYEFSKISNYNHSYLKLINFELKFIILKNFNKLTHIYHDGWKKRYENRCGWDQISKYLEKDNTEAKKIFTNSLERYLEFLNKEENIMKIIIVSFPHKNHLNKKYKVNVSEYINELLKKININKIYHLNFSNHKFLNQINNNIYLSNDVASHLNEEYHSLLFTKNILKSLNDLK